MTKGLLAYLSNKNGHKKAEVIIKRKILSFLILNIICLLMNII